MVINYTAELKKEIESRFGDGKPFSFLDFPLLNKRYGSKETRTNLASLCMDKCKYLTVIGKIKTGIGNMPPVNRYKITRITVENDEYVSVPGQRTEWHSINLTPINKCKNTNITKSCCMTVKLEEHGGMGLGLFQTCLLNAGAV